MVNAFRSGIDRTHPPPPALLRRVAAMKSASMDASGSGSASIYTDSYTNLPNQFPSTSSSIGERALSGDLGSINRTQPLSSSTNIIDNKPIRSPPSIYHHQQHEPLQQQQHRNPQLGKPSMSIGGRSFSTDTDLDGLRNDKIESLLRSETTEVLEEEIDDYFPNTESLSTNDYGKRSSPPIESRPSSSQVGGNNGKMPTSQSSQETSV